MAKAVINLQKESGGIVKISPVDGAGVTEVTVPESGELVTKEYVDTNSFNPTPTIASGTATFNATTNNINLTGIGIGVEVGDVIQISGAEDAKNNSEFTIEVITDDNNIIVNQAHANKGTSKNVAARTGDTGVTVKLLSKWYNAPIGLGQGWVNVTSNRAVETAYLNNTKRTIKASLYLARTSASAYLSFLVGTELLGSISVFSSAGVTTGSTSIFDIPASQSYKCQATMPNTWYELR